MRRLVNKLNTIMDFKNDFNVTKEKGSQVKIEGEIPYEELKKERGKALEFLGKNIEVDGFRKGHVPEKVVVERVGEMALLTEMSERALARVYPEILKAHDITAIGHPQLQITKIAVDNPLGFVATVAVMPDITLPDYKQIAATANKDKATAEVTEEEVETQIKDILRQKVAYERLQAKAQKDSEADTTKKAADNTTDLPTPETVEKAGETETHTHRDGTVHEGPAHEEPEAVQDDEIPELTDELVKELGQPGQFETVDDFKAKLREHLGIEKEREVNAAHRAKITDLIIETAEMDLPRVMIDSEIGQMFAQMEEDLKRANLKMEDYLAHIKKSREDLITEWTPAAEKRAKLQLVLNEIAKKEDVQPDADLVKTQVAELKEQYADADEARVRIYVESILTNEAVMKMLEEQE